MNILSPQHCIVHYDEIALKGRNRGSFENYAIHQLQRLLNPLGLDKIKKPRGRIILFFKENVDWKKINSAIAKVFGVTNYSPVFRCDSELQALKESLSQTLVQQNFKTFGVMARRTNKRFPLTSKDIKIQIGAFIAQQTMAKVNLETPDCWVDIEVNDDAIYYSYERFEGPRGLPIPASGKVMTLISGGIDSPVAAYQIMRRGCENAYVHFHSSPFTNQASIEKVRKIIQALAPYQKASRLYLVPFAPLQQQIVAFAPAALRVILYRRAMVRIAEKLAHQENAEALITGDNLGQVASQTLSNMACIEKACSLPIFRPLLCLDKIHISEMAKKIETYSISILPDQDCCQFMLPEHPATRAPLSLLEKAEGDFPLQEEMDKCLQQTSIEVFT